MAKLMRRQCENDKKISWICKILGLILLYFTLSIGLTFYQRWLLQDIRFPLSLVVCHLTIKFLLSWCFRSIIEWWNGQPRVILSWSNYIKSIAAPGLVSGLDVGLSNWGLEFITISLYTMTKSTAIIFILGFAILFKLERKSWSICLIVLMIASGLFLFTFKATQFDLIGFILVLSASLASGLRWTLAQLIMQKSKLGLCNPIDMVYHMQPLMLLSILPLAVYIEGLSLAGSCKAFRFKHPSQILHTVWTVSGGAIVAFFMEVAEFLVVTHTSSLTLSVAGIFKEVCTLTLAVVWNGDQMNTINVIGLLLCLGGITFHVTHKATMQFSGEPPKIEVNTPLLNEQLSSVSLSDESEDENVLFSILKRREIQR